MRIAIGIAASAVTALLLVGQPAFAADDDETAVGEENTAANEDAGESVNDRICRRVRVTGSHIPQRICMTRGSWARMREHSQREMEDGADNTGIVTSQESPTAANPAAGSGRN